MRILFTSLIVLINCSLSAGQQFYFQSAFGDTATDDGKVVIKTSTGEYCLVGSTGTNTPGLSDIAIYFVDTLGELIANYSYRIGLFGDEIPSDVVETPDGGFVITGYTRTSPLDTNFSDIFALKIDGIFGNIIWAYTYGGADDDFAYSIALTPDNKIYVSGATSSFGSAALSGLVLKLDENGILQGSGNVISMHDVCFINDMQILPNGQLILAGGTFDGISTDHFVAKLDTTGAIQWSKQYGTSGVEYLNSIQPTSDQGFIAAGGSSSGTVGLYDCNVLKLDSTGSITWVYNYGTIEDDIANSIVEDNNQNYVICGTTNVDHLGGRIDQMAIDKIDGLGNIIWSYTYGDTTETSTGANLITGINNGYTATGFSISFGEPNGDAYLVKADDNGYTECNSFPLNLAKNPVTFAEATGATSQFYSVNSGPVILPVQNFVDQYAQNCFFDNINHLSKIQHVKIYPNPSVNFIRVETEFENTQINIFDQFGRRLFSRRNNTYKSDIDISTFSPGIYLLEVKSGKNIARNKFVKE